LRTLANSAIHRKGQTSNQFLKLIYQNIRGLIGKASEILCQLHKDLPHLLRLSEHHFSQFEADLTNTENYTLGAKYCRNKLQRGGVSIFIQSHSQFTALNLDKYFVDQDFEVCELKLDSTFLTLCILVIYRSPLGNLKHICNSIRQGTAQVMYYKIKPYNMWRCEC
jgi:hypothetical protein